MDRRIGTFIRALLVNYMNQRTTKIMEDVIAKTKAYVKESMSRNDASHDYAHVERVLGWAQKIHVAQQALHPHIAYNPHLVILASLLHDVGDHKYVQPGDAANNNHDRLAADFLLSAGADPGLARQVQRIVTHVSYTREMHDPALVQRIIAEIPELAIVQDADRLDALGAVGIARCLVFGAAMRPEQGLEGSWKHFEHKLEKLQGLMKTETGIREAEVRTARLRVFSTWWREEMGGIE